MAEADLGPRHLRHRDHRLAAGATWSRAFVDPGDVVLAERAVCIKARWVPSIAYQAQVVRGDGRPRSATGRAGAGDRRVACQGKRVKFLYTIPNFNNPSGITQPLERRRQVLDVATRHDLLIVEDNPYGLLNLESDPIPAIRSLDSERIIYLGSFSKTFAPGFRVGWALAPHAVREKLVLAQESATLCPPVFSQFAISSYLDSWDWRGQITSFKDMYRARRDAMLEGLSEHMPAGTTWTRPAGGFFVWVTLPEGLDSQAMLPRAVTARVAYVPGPAFYADGFGTRFMRLSYCFPTPERIIEGTRRLGEVLHEELEMRRTFGLGVAGPTSSRDLSGPGPDLS
jgi:DNA-binding transcriptional MocR family regulator